MPTAELSSLKSRISKVANGSPVGSHIADIMLEVEENEQGSEFLRVLIEIKSFKGIGDKDLASLIESIENSVLDVDDRFPSVRFSEAA